MSKAVYDWSREDRREQYEQLRAEFESEDESPSGCFAPISLLAAAIPILVIGLVIGVMLGANSAKHSATTTQIIAPSIGNIAPSESIADLKDLYGQVRSADSELTYNRWIRAEATNDCLLLQEHYNQLVRNVSAQLLHQNDLPAHLGDQLDSDCQDTVAF
ncbi:MAG TPA: hypothetical protein VLF41_01480 [Candidatus Nanoarchaeia archaeon]|nr:hypothetical protein [Candidatus Nanoarchaeia archaeon]